MVTAAIKDSIEDLGDLWDDPAHSIEQNKILEFFTHMSSSSFALWSNIFASNLMTQDFFEVMAIFFFETLSPFSTKISSFVFLEEHEEKSSMIKVL